MGDRCYVNLVCRAIDHERFEDLGFTVLDGCLGPSTVLLMEEPEANYGETEALQALANEGIPFYGAHDAGGEYPAMMFASADGASIWVEGFDETPLVPVTPEFAVTGVLLAVEVSPHALEQAREYFTRLRSAKARLGQLVEESRYADAEAH